MADGGKAIRHALSAATLLVLLRASVVAAQGSVSWQAPSECPSAEQAEAEVARLVQGIPSSAASVVIARVSPSQLRASVSVAANGGTRAHVLHDASCKALTQAAALIVAMATDQTSHPVAREPSPQADVAHRYEVSLRPEVRERGVLAGERVVGRGFGVTPSAASSGGSAVKQLGVSVGAAVGVSSGMVPGIAPLFGLHVGATLGSLCAALRLGFAPPQAALLQTPTGVGGSVALALAALEAGLRFEGLGFELPIVAGVEPGLFFASGHGVPDSSPQRRDWLAAYLSPSISHTWGQRVRGFVRLDGVLALRRPRFAIEAEAGALVFHQPDRLSARLYLGLDVILR